MLWEYKKSNRHTGKLTEAIYLETANKESNMREQGGHRLNVSGVLRHLGVSRSGYNTWKTGFQVIRSSEKTK